MSKKRRAFVELQPAHYTMVRQIFSDARFGNSQMVREFGLQSGIAASSRAAAGQMADGDTKGVARLDVIVGGEIVVGKDENAGASRRLVGLIQLGGRATQQATQLHFQERRPRGKAGVAEAAFYARLGSIHAGLDGQGRNFAARRRLEPIRGVG